MRTFIALEIDASMRDRIATWCTGALPPIGRAIDSSNYHITLAFLGEQDDTVLSLLCRDCDRIPSSHYDLTLDTTGYFPRPRVYWIGPSVIPDDLARLYGDLRKACRRAGIRVDKRPFQPHLTLFRKCDAKPPLPAVEPDFLLSCQGFALFESVSTTKGVQYRVLQCWTG